MPKRSNERDAMIDTTSPIPTGRLLAYAGLRMPLAVLELPLFVLLPSLYGVTHGVELALIGIILFTTRFADAIIDPIIGVVIDRNSMGWHFRRWIWLALPIIAVGFVALMNPPNVGSWLPAWLAVMSMLTYLGYSLASIAYQAWGSRIGQTDAQRARVTGLREAAGLCGVLLAAAWLTADGAQILTLLFLGLATVAAIALRLAPTGLQTRHQPGSANPFTSLLALTANRQFCWLLAALVINGVATAIPATLMLFFVADILNSASMGPTFLVVYFLAGAVGMPLWIGLSGRIGLKKTWLIGIGFSIVAFVWALKLGAGDSNAFIVICMLTGLALGADLAMPPALLASVIAAHGDAGRNEGTYFGIWNFATKVNLAAAAGLALPMLSLSGYQPGTPDSTALLLVYAGLPCLMKMLTGIVLLVSPLPNGPDRTTLTTT